MNRLLTGNEVVAAAAVVAGVDYFSHYPGSPVNQVEPFYKKLKAEYNLPVVRCP